MKRLIFTISTHINLIISHNLALLQFIWCGWFMGISHILFGSAVAHIAVIDFELVAIFVGGFADG